jgi:hypothetical protein
MMKLIAWLHFVLALLHIHTIYRTTVVACSSLLLTVVIGGGAFLTLILLALTTSYMSLSTTDWEMTL